MCKQTRNSGNFPPVAGHFSRSLWFSYDTGTFSSVRCDSNGGQLKHCFYLLSFRILYWASRSRQPKLSYAFLSHESSKFGSTKSVGKLVSQKKSKNSLNSNTHLSRTLWGFFRATHLSRTFDLSELLLYFEIGKAYSGQTRGCPQRWESSIKIAKTLNFEAFDTEKPVRVLGSCS